LVKYPEPGLDSIFSALADPVRRRVTEELTTGEKTMSELAEPFDISMPAVMKHIAVLERSGIVLTEKRGRVRYCRLQPERLGDAERWLAETSRFWRRRLEALDRFLQEQP
jgi:DNA-binding transcriptional ArsR family regulator